MAGAAPLSGELYPWEENWANLKNLREKVVATVGVLASLSFLAACQETDDLRDKWQIKPVETNDIETHHLDCQNQNEITLNVENQDNSKEPQTFVIGLADNKQLEINIPLIGLPSTATARAKEYDDNHDIKEYTIYYLPPDDGLTHNINDYADITVHSGPDRVIDGVTITCI